MDFIFGHIVTLVGSTLQAILYRQKDNVTAPVICLPPPATLAEYQKRMFDHLHGQVMS